MSYEISRISTRFPDIPKGMTPTYTFYNTDGRKLYTQELYEGGALKKSRSYSVDASGIRDFWSSRINPDGSETIYRAEHLHRRGRSSDAFQKLPNGSIKGVKGVGPWYTTWAKDRQFASGMKGKLQKMATKIACDANGCERKGLKNIGGFLFKLAQKI